MKTRRDIDERIMDAAQSWVGTPYRHQGHKKHIGCDCLGLVRGIWRETYGLDPEEPTPYARDWAEHANEERMLDAARRHCGPELDLSELHEGCLLLFRWRNGSAIKHAGILTAPHQFIHAYERVGVTSSPLVPSWRRRIAAIFEFPPAIKPGQ